MNGISVNIVVFLLNGVPQSFLMVWALHIFTGTRINVKKYFLLSFIYAVAAYLIRFLPIAIGVNSVLTLLVMIMTFQFTYKTQLSKVIRTIVSATVAFVLIAVSEILNMLLLVAAYGQFRAEELFNSKDGLTRSLYATPSNIIFAIFIFIGYLILMKLDKRKRENGETGKKTGE